MRKEGRIQNWVIALFGIAIVAMSIGFAAYSTTLTIGGGNGNTAQATFTPTTWDVHYDADGYSPVTTSGYTAPSSHTISNTDIQFAVTLARPGDQCQFTVPVVNDGDFDAYLNSVTMSDPNLPFVSWKLTYDGVDYTQTTTGIQGKVLPHETGNTKNLTVYVKYEMPESENDLPIDSNKTVSFTASLVFDQED